MNIKKLRFCWGNSTEKNMKSACLFAAGSRRNVSSFFLFGSLFRYEYRVFQLDFPTDLLLRSFSLQQDKTNIRSPPGSEGFPSYATSTLLCYYCRLVEVVKEVRHMAANCKKASDSISTDCRRSNCHKIGS